MIPVTSSPGAGQQRIHCLFIAVAVLVVYISALGAGYLPIDDGGMLQAVQSGKLSIYHLFLSGGKEYYRPLATLSLMGDFFLFGGRTTGYHLGNILIHLFNALLAYRLAMHFFKGEQSPFLPFIAALLFAVHPVNTEAVVWISCRPDLLCCFFSLLCLNLLFTPERGSGPAVFACLGLFFLCSLLAKEASLFIPAAAACYFFLERKSIGPRTALSTMAALILALFVYLLLRQGFPLASQTVRPTATAPGEAAHGMGVIDAAAAFGFYIRKLLFPFPLSLTITKINSSLYAGMALIFISVAAFLSKKAPGLRTPMVFLGASLTPPIGAMLILPLWTPYAERYLYLPSVAFALCAIVALNRFGARIPRFVVIACILALASAAVSRVRLWTNPLLFWQKAVMQAPDHGTARLVLASEYLKSGQYRQADENLRLAVRLGLSGKSRESSLELRKQLDEKMGLATELSQTGGVKNPKASEPMK